MKQFSSNDIKCFFLIKVLRSCKVSEHVFSEMKFSKERDL